MRIIPREEYDHPGPLGPPMDLARITGWVAHHTAGPKGQSVKSIAQVGINRFGRSSYSFVNTPTDPDNIYEMQGLHTGAHTGGHNSHLLSISFIGFYHPEADHEPSHRQLEAAAQLMAHGHEEWGIPLRIDGHRDYSGTSCPGDNIYYELEAIVSRAKHLVNGEEEPVAGEGPTPPRGWADSVWREYARETGTDPSTRTWNFWREDLAWVWKREIQPLEDKVKVLEARVKQLEER